MTLTAIVGALMAIVARPDPWDRLEKLTSRLDQLARSQAKLIDHIERLERELKAQHRLTAHWREEALRLARQSREERQQFLPQMAMAQAQQAQQNMQMAQQAQMQQYAQQAQLAQQAYPYCNCVPSRAQVWASPNALVEELNAVGHGGIVRLR